MNEKWTLTITYSFFFKCLVTKRISIKVKVIVNQSQVKVCYLCCRLRLVIITSRRIKTFPCCNTCNNNKVSQWNKGVAFSKDDLWRLSGIVLPDVMPTWTWTDPYLYYHFTTNFQWRWRKLRSPDNCKIKWENCF